MARGYTRRNYLDELASFSTRPKDLQKKIYNNIAAAINARIKQFDGVTMLSSDLMDEVRKLKKTSPELFTKQGNFKRSANKDINKRFLDLVNVLYTLDDQGKPATRDTAKKVKQEMKERIEAKDISFVKHLQHKAEALGTTEELRKMVGTKFYKEAKKKPSDDEDNNNVTSEEELNMNNTTSMESKLKESGLTPEQWLDATTLAYVGHILKKYKK